MATSRHRAPSSDGMVFRYTATAPDGTKLVRRYYTRRDSDSDIGAPHGYVALAFVGTTWMMGPFAVDKRDLPSFIRPPDVIVPARRVD